MHLQSELPMKYKIQAQQKAVEGPRLHGHSKTIGHLKTSNPLSSITYSRTIVHSKTFSTTSYSLYYQSITVTGMAKEGGRIQLTPADESVWRIIDDVPESNTTTETAAEDMMPLVPEASNDKDALAPSEELPISTPALAWADTCTPEEKTPLTPTVKTIFVGPLKEGL